MKFLKILTVVFLMALLQSVNAQVVIKENIELNTEQMDRKAKTADELGFSETMILTENILFIWRRDVFV